MLYNGVLTTMITSILLTFKYLFYSHLSDDTVDSIQQSTFFFFFTYWYIFYFHLSLSFHLSSAVKGTLANNRAQLDSVLTLEPNRMGRILLLPPGCDVTFGQAVKFSTPKFSSADWDGNTAYFHRLLRSLNELTYIKPLKYYLHQ